MGVGLRNGVGDALILDGVAENAVEIDDGVDNAAFEIVGFTVSINSCVENGVAVDGLGVGPNVGRGVNFSPQPTSRATRMIGQNAFTMEIFNVRLILLLLRCLHSLYVRIGKRRFCLKPSRHNL